MLCKQDRAMSHYELGRSLVHWTVVVAVLFGFTATQTAAQEQAYSKEWMIDMLNSGESGLCSSLSHTYRWRNVGWGSNLNRFLALWLQTIVRDSESNDFGLDVTPGFFGGTKCPVASKTTGEDIYGWKCFFQPMARLCVFESDEDLGNFLIANYKETQRPNLPRPTPRARLHDETETAAALLGYVYSNMQPWFKEDTDSILRENDVASVRSGRYVAIHVRRGDKLIKEASRTEVQVYLEAAASTLRNSTEGVDGPNSIVGLWVSSDDSNVVPEVKELASRYFPNVQDERVVSISFRTKAPAQHGNNDELPTTSHLMTYELYVGLHAELHMMSHADVFIGTYSSNIGRLVYLFREVNGLPRYSTHSVDDPTWHFGRRELAMDGSFAAGF
ncbi:unnamed protein product [Ectocarpus sp. 13 AM-2016]